MKFGSDLLLEVLEREGVRYIFGNPGTTEMPIMHSLRRHPDLRYVLGLQEAAVVAMADGFARASGRPLLSIFTRWAALGTQWARYNTLRSQRLPCW